MGAYLNKLNRKLLATDKTNYYREQYQSFMTAPEWRNVEMAEEFADFLKQGNSMFRYPYFRQILDLWKVVYHSYSAAKKHNSRWAILTSEYMVMDIFVAFFTTLEMLPRGFLSLFLRPFLNKNNSSALQDHFADYYAQYATKIETIPFFDHEYKETRLSLAQAYRDSPSKTLVDWFSWKCISLELRARHWISKPLSKWFNQEGNVTAPSTDILVKCRMEGIQDHDEAKEEFMARLETIDGTAKATLVDEHLYVKEQNPEKNYLSVYARLNAPRFKPFQNTVLALAHEDIHLRKIAGQDLVQIKCDVKVNDRTQFIALDSKLNQIPGVKKLYSYGDRINNFHKFCLFSAPVENLHKTLINYNTREGVDVTFVHNF